MPVLGRNSWSTGLQFQWDISQLMTIEDLPSYLCGIYKLDLRKCPPMFYAAHLTKFIGMTAKFLDIFHACDVVASRRWDSQTHPSQSKSDYLRTRVLFIHFLYPPKKESFFTRAQQQPAPNNCPHIKCDFVLEKASTDNYSCFLAPPDICTYINVTLKCRFRGSMQRPYMETIISHALIVVMPL